MDRNCELPSKAGVFLVALRKESVDRNSTISSTFKRDFEVALRKESVDRNRNTTLSAFCNTVALRKESVDRNAIVSLTPASIVTSLSARRAWIEIVIEYGTGGNIESLSARRAWIEIHLRRSANASPAVALRKESVDRNLIGLHLFNIGFGRSPQGERG